VTPPRRGEAGLARRRRREPAWRRWRRWLVRLLAGLLPLAAGWWLLTAPVFAVRRVTTTPCRYVSRDTLAARARPWLGRNLWRCRPGDLARRLEALPWVARATVHRRPPATLAVRIREHRPLLLLGEEESDGTGPPVLLEDGGVARLAGGRPPPDLPLLIPPGGAPAAGLPDSVRGDLAALCRAVAAVGLENDTSRVDFVRIAPEGYRLLLGGAPRRELWLGRGDFTARLQRYLAVRGRLDPGGVVDLRFRNQVARRPLAPRGGKEQTP